MRLWGGRNREPFKPSRKEIREHDRRAELADLLLPILSETSGKQFAYYEAWRIAGVVINSGYRRTK